MRKTIYILFAILGMSLFAGCDDDKKDNNTPLAKQLVGEWRLTSWTGQAPQVFDAYIGFDLLVDGERPAVECDVGVEHLRSLACP